MGPQISPALKVLLVHSFVPLFALVAVAGYIHRVFTGQYCQPCFHVITAPLVGIAVNALAWAVLVTPLTGRDPQARSITFWNLGNFQVLPGCRWLSVQWRFVTIVIAWRYSRQLNALLLGEEEAAYLREAGWQSWTEGDCDSEHENGIRSAFTGCCFCRSYCSVYHPASYRRW